ncbi:MAG: cytochrome c [Acidobacteriota bacterium]|nr:cytochrome c [Acidobacteriota bacterium]
MSRCSATCRLGRAAVALLVAMLAATAIAAQERRFDVGHAPTSEEFGAWSGSAFPDGTGLPPGQGTAREGAALYREACFVCHGHNARGDQAAALVGGRDTLTESRPKRTVESYWPYATTLWDYTKRSMPYEEPGSLTDDQVYAVVAYVLNLAGLVEEDEIVDADSLPQIRMPNRDGFIPDSRPDTR